MLPVVEFELSFLLLEQYKIAVTAQEVILSGRRYAVCTVLVIFCCQIS
jgi:hypothetical protein